MPVFTRSRKNGFRQLAEEIAEDRGETVVERLENLSQGEDVYYVDPPDMLSSSVINELQQRYITSSGMRFSIITGRDVEEARSLYYRDGSGTEENKGHCVVSPDVKRSVSAGNENVVCLLGNDATTENLTEAADGVYSLSAVLHGTDMYSHLSDGYIVGLPENPGRHEFNSPQPPYIKDGGIDTERLQGDVMKPSEVDVSHVFLNGCSGLLMGKNKGQSDPAHLALELISQSTSFIGTYRVTECIPFHGILNNNLLLDGYSTAERAYILNRSAISSGIEAYPYVIAGDLDSRKCEKSAHEEVSSIEQGNRKIRLSLDEVGSTVVDITVSAEDFYPGQDSYYLRYKGEYPGGPLYYTCFREGGEIRVVITTYDWSKIDNHLEFEIHPCSVADETNVDEKVRRALSSKEAGVEVNVDARRQLEQAEGNLNGVSDKVSKEGYNAFYHYNTRDCYEEAEERLEDGRHALAEKLDSRTSESLQEDYKNTSYAVSVDTVEGGCPYCGENVYIQERRDVAGRLKRKLGRCANCAYVFDTPGDASSEEYPVIRKTSNGTEFSMEVEFKNPRKYPVEATFKPVFSHEYENKEYDPFTPSTTDVSIETGETESVEFEVDIGTALDAIESSTIDGHYTIEVHSVLDTLEVFTGIRTLYRSSDQISF